MRLKRESPHGPISCRQQSLPLKLAQLSGGQPIEECDAVTLGYRRRAVVDDLATMCGKHNFHVNKGNGQPLRLERPCGEQFVKVSRGYYFRAFGTTREQMFQDASKEARTVCG